MELREIRKLLESPPAQPAPEGIMAEFIDFLSKFRVIGLAAGFILSLYLGGLVKSFVDGFVMPIIGLILPCGELGERHRVDIQTRHDPVSADNLCHGLHGGIPDGEGRKEVGAGVTRRNSSPRDTELRL